MNAQWRDESAGAPAEHRKRIQKHVYILYQGLSALLLPAVLVYWIAKMAWRRDYLVRLTERFGARKIDQPADAKAARPSIDVKMEPDASLCFWIHAVSVGEVMAATPLIRGLQARFPQCRIVISTMTPAGRETAQRNCPDIDVVMYFPVDFFLIVRGGARHLRGERRKDRATP